MLVVNSYDKSICRLPNAGHDPGSKENLVKMICSPPSGMVSFLGGISHPEMFCVDVGGNDNSRCTRSRKNKSFGILVSIFVLFLPVTQNLKTIQSHISCLVKVHYEVKNVFWHNFWYL